MVAIVDYGVGNLQSLERAFSAAGAITRVTGDEAELSQASAIVLPGVGHFQEAMEHLHARGLIAALERRVMGEGVPLLGVCLGMQLLMQRSDEGDVPGLGWISGQVRGLRQLCDDPALRVPHIGWNAVNAPAESRLFTGLPQGSCFYFAHSFAAPAADAEYAAHAVYGAPFVAAVEQGNLFGTQFHPEKSHANGLHLLRNFLAYAAAR